MKKLGIENLKVAVVALIGLGADVDKIYADGDFDLSETRYFVDDLVKAPALVEALPYVPSEIADLDEDETKELHEFVAAELSLTNKGLEAVIERGVKLGLQVYLLFAEAKGLAQEIKELQK